MYRSHLGKLKKIRQNLLSKIRYDAWMTARQAFRIIPQPKNRGERVAWTQLPEVVALLSLVTDPFSSEQDYKKFSGIVNKAVGASRISSLFRDITLEQEAGLKAFTSIAIEVRCTGETHVNNGKYNRIKFVIRFFKCDSI